MIQWMLRKTIWFMGLVYVTLDKFVKYEDSDKILDGDVNMWDFYNACTDVLWHEEKPTMASFEHNQVITDKLLKAMA